MTYEKASHHTFTITRFRDGDTCEGFYACRCCGSSNQDVLRLLGIESWETKGAQRARAVTVAETLTGIYRGQSGLLIPGTLRRDIYHRILGDIIFGDQSLSALLVRDGFAWYGVGEPQPNE